MIEDFALLNATPRTVCFGKGVRAVQIRDVAIQYLASHPQERHYDAASSVLKALQQAFPCSP